MQSQFKLSCAVANRVVSFVRSFLSQWTWVGWRYELMSSSRLLAGLLPIPFRFGDIAEFQLEMSFLQRPLRCLAIILAWIRYFLLCLGIRDVIPPAVNNSSDFWVARSMSSTSGSSSSSGSSCGRPSQEVAAFFLLVEVLRLVVGVVGLVVGNFVHVRGVCSCGTCSWLSFRLDDHPHHPSFCRLEFLLHLFRHGPPPEA